MVPDLYQVNQTISGSLYAICIRFIQAQPASGQSDWLSWDPLMMYCLGTKAFSEIRIKPIYSYVVP